MAQVLNQSFRDWSSTRKFPFTEGSDMTCQDGRRIPVSAFSMISLCPDTEGTARVTLIDSGGIHVGLPGWEAIASFSDYADGWIPVMKSGNCVGCVMTAEPDLSYVKGMASVKPMVFTEGHLELRPETVKGFCLASTELSDPPTIDGHPTQDISVSYDSDRFINTAGSISVDTEPVVTDETEPIESIVLGEGAAEEAYMLMYPGNLVIRTPWWCDTQFTAGDDSVVFHQRGS